MRFFISFLFYILSFSVQASVAPNMLFLCTGNYYRSRLAEAVFNFEAEKAGLPWRATSRGLRTDLLSADERKLALSPLTAKMLDTLHIPQSYTSAAPVQVTRKDMENATCVIAMSEREHRPYLEKAFAPLARWPLSYWHVEDIELAKPEDALPVIVKQTRQLVADLKAGNLPQVCRPKFIK